jgi:hypothetical protein
MDEILNGDAHDIDMSVDFSRIDDVYAAFRAVSKNEWKIHLLAKKDNGNLIAINLYKLENGMPLLLHFDLFKAFGWNGYTLIPYKKLLAGRKQINGVYEAADAVKAVTMLFSRYLYHGYIKNKYRIFIADEFRKERDNVVSVMKQFLPTEFVDSIYEDVIEEDWKNIEQEWNSVKNAVKRCADKHEPHMNLKMWYFNLMRMINHTGLIVCLPKGKPLQQYRLYIKSVQNLLSRTFAESDIDEKFLFGGVQITSS